MKRYDLYVYVRSLTYLLLLTAILVSINWINLSVRALDQLVSAGQAPGVIAQYILLLLPLSASNAIPLSTFVAATYLFYRMHADREITVLKNTGMGPIRLMCPFIVFGICGTMLSALLAHIVIPHSERLTYELDSSTHDSLTSRQIKHGQFHFPIDGVALFVASVSDDRTLENVFIHDARDRKRERTYFAETASLVRINLDPVLELYSGQVEEWNSAEKTLEMLSFESLRFNLSKFTATRGVMSTRLKNMSSMELLGKLQRFEADHEAELRGYLIEIHDRIVKSFRSLVYTLFGVSALLMADAFGIRQRYTLIPAILAIVALHVTGDYLEAAANEAAFPAVLMHSHHFLALLAVAVMLIRSSTAGRLTRGTGSLTRVLQ